MSEPLYHVGQKVAVCTSNLSTVIPETSITNLKWVEFALSRNLGGIEQNIWAYAVADHDVFIAERCLRPLLDDDYKTESEEQERSNANSN